MKPLADSPVGVARSTLREVASHAGCLHATRPVRSELAIVNDGLHGLCMHATLKRAPCQNYFQKDSISGISL